MSTFPAPVPNDPEETPSGDPSDTPASDPLSPANTPRPPGEWTGEPEEPNPQLQFGASEAVAPPSTREDFLSEPIPFSPAPSGPDFSSTDFSSPIHSGPIFSAVLLPPGPRDERIPNLGNLGLLTVLAIIGWVGAGLFLLLALRIHLWGITSLTAATTDFRYNLSSQAVQYFITFAACLGIFPIVWHRPFFDGIHWNGFFAVHRSGRLVSAAVFCFFVAMVNGVLMPGPTNAPIDQLFKSPGAAWALFAFGISVAPFFEEMAFRGFLLPSLCTAWDWTVEHISGAPRRPLDEDGNPQWSRPAMIVAAIITSIPFASMHGAQTGWSLGPFLLLIFVSLVLCWVRLSMRSLAASTMVHACYNLMLFSFMLLGTGGFKHLDKM
jgi:hypothetical protein